MPRRNRTEEAELKLENALLLNKYILSLLGVNSFERLADMLKSPGLEGWDENNVSKFHLTLCNELEQNIAVSRDDLRRYDENICRHTTHINEHRHDKVVWKYFQYLYLLFVEIYLDRYFSSADELLEQINIYRTDVFCHDANNCQGVFTEPVKAEQLQKLACWCATGAGKTLMMHINMLQVREYADKYGRKFTNTLLVTPKESLSRQHLDELGESNIMSHTFSKQAGTMMSNQYVQVIEITKLAEKNGDKQVAVESFETDNLVFVDEGHRGTSGDTWKPLRDQLSEKGFTIEYSATFGQSIAAESKRAKKLELLNEYGASALFDYSYRYFYYDGYGKDFVTRNMNGAFTEQQETLYLTGGLLGFYEQLRLFADFKDELADFMIERPVAIFVGSTVSTAKERQEVSDIVRITRFFQYVVTSPRDVARDIDHLLQGTDGLIDGSGKSVFKEAFHYLKHLGIDGSAVYQDMLRVMFNSNVSGVKLHIDNLKSIDGEIGLRMGEADYFGVINVGNAKSVMDACAEFAVTGVRDFMQHSLFENINARDSKVNILIGAKKFTEGWSSWRVATMCLLNVGTGDGSEIIQLFGRGVRLKGYRYCLKRTNRLESDIRPANTPRFISILETLNIFGVKADYMDEFSKIIKAEGVATSAEDAEEVVLPVMPNVVDLEKKRLKYLRIKKGKDYKKDVQLVNLVKDDEINFDQVVIDRYAHIKAFASDDISSESLEIVKETLKLGEEQLKYINWTRLYFDVLEYKRLRGWYNLAIDRKVLVDIAKDPEWYTLFMPSSAAEGLNYSQSFALWQDVLTSLLKGYVDKFYKRKRGAWVSHNLEIGTITEDEAGYHERIHLKVKRELFEQFKDKIDALKRELANKTFSQKIDFQNGAFGALFYARHLYSPLMYYNAETDKDKMIEISPVPLNKGEKDMVNSMMNYTQSNPEALKGCEVYLLRNKSQTGVGFFVGAGFYPDFILWIVKGRHQYVTFIDPHGLAHARAFTDEKIQLYKMLQDEIQQELGDKNLTLNSYILSPTKFGKVQHWGKAINPKATTTEIKQMFRDYHVFFMEDNYVNSMMQDIVG